MGADRMWVGKDILQGLRVARRPWPNTGQKKQKNVRKITFFSLKNKIYPKKIFFFCIYLLVMPKYWVKNYFAHGRKKKKRKKKRRRDWTMVITMAKLRMAHASTHGARKPPGPIQRMVKFWNVAKSLVSPVNIWQSCSKLVFHINNFPRNINQSILHSWSKAPELKKIDKDVVQCKHSKNR